tara:strand:+ start:161 stop:649 length:489 start_codon:yes stop_codon:yes gene_type:complete
MKITRKQLRNIIKEELTRLDEQFAPSGGDGSVVFFSDEDADGDGVFDLCEPGVNCTAKERNESYVLDPKIRKFLNDDIGIPWNYSVDLLRVLLYDDEYNLDKTSLWEKLTANARFKDQMKEEIGKFLQRPGVTKTGVAGEVLDATAEMLIYPEEYFANQGQE